MSMIRCLCLRSGRLHRSSYSCLIPLQTCPEEVPSRPRYHSLLSLANVSAFQSWPIASYRSFGSSAVAEWVLHSGVSKAYALHNVADALASLQHLIAFLHSLTFPQWWVCLIVTSLLIRGVAIPDLIHLLKTIADFFKTLGSNAVTSQGEILHKGSLLSKSPRVMYTMLEKEYFGVRGSIIGDGIQVPVVWFSVEELRKNMVEILMSCLRGKTLTAELIKNRVLSRGRLVVVVGDGFGLEIQMFDLDFSLILRRRQVSEITLV